MTSFFKDFKNDFPASIVVFLVAVPLCLGIALASGAPMFSGIIAGFVGGIVVPLFFNPFGITLELPVAHLLRLLLPFDESFRAFRNSKALTLKHL